MRYSQFAVSSSDFYDYDMLIIIYSKFWQIINMYFTYLLYLDLATACCTPTNSLEWRAVSMVSLDVSPLDSCITVVATPYIKTQLKFIYENNAHVVVTRVRSCL